MHGIANLQVDGMHSVADLQVDSMHGVAISGPVVFSDPDWKS